MCVFPTLGIFFGIFSTYSIEISGLCIQILCEFSYMLVVHKIYIYDRWNKVVIRLLHSCISDIVQSPALMRLPQYRCFVHCLGCFRAKTGRKSSHSCSGLWHRPYTVQTGENYLNFRKCDSWNFCYYFLKCLFHFFSCLKLLKVIYLLHMACDLKNRVLYTCFGVKWSL